MIDNILTLLELAKEQDIRSDNIDQALGKYKLPISFADVKNSLKLKK
jgi:hypothetical protein|tara:strand:+ start:355 stop:495 length:141 start_codon:yes stop_codon:yes gene_type:complete